MISHTGRAAPSTLLHASSSPGLNAAGGGGGIASGEAVSGVLRSWCRAAAAELSVPSVSRSHCARLGHCGGSGDGSAEEGSMPFAAAPSLLSRTSEICHIR